MKYYLETLILACITTVGLYVLYIVSDVEKEKIRNKAQISPCECLNYYQWQYWSTKRDILLNKRNLSRKDSIEINNVDRLLGLDEPQQVYPPK